MKFVKSEMHNIAYTEEVAESKDFFPLVLAAEQQVFTDGLYKNGPTMIETRLSTFGEPGEQLYKIYIPVNEKIQAGDGFKYIKRLILEQTLSNKVSLDENFGSSIDQMKDYLSKENFQVKDDTVYLTVYPVFGDYWVDIQIPVEAKL